MILLLLLNILHASSVSFYRNYSCFSSKCTITVKLRNPISHLMYLEVETSPTDLNERDVITVVGKYNKSNSLIFEFQITSINDYSCHFFFMDKETSIKYRTECFDLNSIFQYNSVELTFCQ